MRAATAVMPEVDLDATVAWLGLRHNHDWEAVAHSFAAFLNFVDTLGGDDKIRMRKVDPLSFTPRLLEHRWHYWCWRREQRRAEQAARPRGNGKKTRAAQLSAGLGEGVEEGPSGFNILRDSLKAQVDDIHAQVQGMLPSLADDDSSSDGDDMPEVFFSGHDWSKVKLPGDPGWEDPDRSPPRAAKPQQAAKPRAPAPSPAAPPAPAQPAADAAPRRREPFGVFQRGFVSRPMMRPSECDPDDDDALEADFMRRLEQSDSRQPRARSPSELDRLLSLVQADAASPEHPAHSAPAASPPRQCPPAATADESSAKAASPPRGLQQKSAAAAQRAVPQRPGRWQVIEHSDDSDDEPAAPPAGKGKGKGKGSAAGRHVGGFGYGPSAALPAPEPTELDCRPPRRVPQASVVPRP
eukprot:TRINITY_DN690_c0_g3_i1.p1 TRINITY_DN690_c0_g3~~TRINITY_DN690_c0_g3_i1.p1  ORF type:complete len:410 (+),score=96.52 TRINITY_DN690_c0_g3_i1:98-1327(+)